MQTITRPLTRLCAHLKGTDTVEAGPERAPLLRQLRWLLLSVPVVLAVSLAGVHRLAGPTLSPWTDLLVTGSVALVVAAIFYRLLTRRVQLLQRDLVRQNRELLGLHGAALAVSADLSLDTVLQTVVDRACSLVGARYGALSVVDQEGQIQIFVTSGIPADLRARIGAPPQGRGLLGRVLKEGQRLRLDQLDLHPDASGFPPHHPQMRTLLAVPVLCRGPYRGNLYLSEKEDGDRFTPEEEETLVRFARQAAIAIDNAFLHRQVHELATARERLRIAHEMHDGVAQVLAFVNTQTQVVREYCKQRRMEDAETQLERLADTSRQVYADVRAQILELRSATPSEDGLAGALSRFVEQWQRLTGIEVALDVPAPLQLDPHVELQLLRIVQEALANVRKHARASRVEVALAVSGDQFQLVIIDDGVGFDPEATVRGTGPRFGLATMRERAESVGGMLEIASASGAGTRMEINLPRGPITLDKELAHASTHR
jgi:signal transduction histidine kinase